MHMHMYARLCLVTKHGCLIYKTLKLENFINCVGCLAGCARCLA